MPFSDITKFKLKMMQGKEIENIKLSRRTLLVLLFHKKRNFMLPQVICHLQGRYLKRAASFAFRKAAFVSIEAAVCLLVFLIAIMSLLSFGTVINQKMRMEAALRNTASKIAQDYAFYEALRNDDKGMLEDLAIKGIGTAAARELFLNELGKEKIDNSCISGGSKGISFIYSDILDDQGYVDIVITYEMKLPFKLIPLPSVKMTQRSRIHPWTGVEAVKEENDRESYVYVTKTGKVYHLSLSCKYLNIKVSKINIKEIEQVRNEYGAKYYPCKLCNKEDIEANIYITKTGTSYHVSKDCPSLTRDVKKVPKSECIGMPACSGCGG